MGLDRWNEDRADKPADYMVSKHTKTEEKVVEAKGEEPVTEATIETPTEIAEEKPKRGRKPKKKENEE